MTREDRSESAAGFTLLEVLVVLAIVAIAALIGFPALLNMLQRAKTDSAVRQAAMEFRAARLDALKQSSDVYVQADFTEDKLVVWRETSDDGFTPATDNQVRELKLPKGIYFWAPTDAAAEGTNATEPASTPVFTFLSSGAAKEIGGFRFSDGRGNFFEVHVEPKATARISLRKYDPDEGDVLKQWKVQDQDGKRWDWQ